MACSDNIEQIQRTLICTKYNAIMKSLKCFAVRVHSSITDFIFELVRTRSVHLTEIPLLINIVFFQPCQFTISFGHCQIISICI